MNHIAVICLVFMALYSIEMNCIVLLLIVLYCSEYYRIVWHCFSLYCNALYCFVVQCIALQWIVWYGFVLYSFVSIVFHKFLLWLSIVMHFPVLYCNMLFCIVLYGGRTGWWVVVRKVGGCGDAALQPRQPGSCAAAAAWWPNGLFPCRNRGIKRTRSNYIIFMLFKLKCYNSQS